VGARKEVQFGELIKRTACTCSTDDRHLARL